MMRGETLPAPIPQENRGWNAAPAASIPHPVFVHPSSAAFPPDRLYLHYLRGSSTVKAAPRPAALRTVREPPNRSTIVRLMVSPRPSPPGVVL